MDAKAIDSANKISIQPSRKTSPLRDPSKASTSSVKTPDAGEDSVTLSSSGKTALGEAAGSSSPATSSAPNASGSDLSGSVEGALQREFSVTDSNRVVLKIIDPETKDVIKQIPPEGELRLREAIRDQVENLSSTDDFDQP